MPRKRGSSRSNARGTAGGRRGPKRTLSSKRWLDRQHSDPYVTAARREGYRSRAAFKLLEIDDRFGLLKQGRRVVDLGAAPGGWSQVAAERSRGGVVVALDRNPIDPIAGVVAIAADFLSEDAPRAIARALGGPADLVLSDLAPATTGHSATDHLRIMAMAEAAYEFAETVLAEGGDFVAKVFQGGTEKSLLDRLRLRFRQVKHVKPPASRKESNEIYVVATGFRRTPEVNDDAANG